MPYTVTWQRGAQNALAHIWNQAPNRNAVKVAADRIDRMLQLAPTSVGTVTGSVCRLRIAPLEVVFTVSPPDRRVEVLLVSFRP